jgi:hypothetical protein
MTEQTQVTNSPAAPGGGGNRMLIIGGIAALAVVAIVVVGAVVLIPKLFGADENAIANVMPPKTSVLVELNALNLANEDANRIARAFEDALNESDVEFNADDPASLLEQLDNDLDDASGLTITDDILPWIGPNLGVGVVKLDIEAIDQGEVPQLIFASTIRDIDLADKFIEDLIDAIESESDNKVDEVEYGGALVFEIDSDIDDERLAFGRSDKIFFIAANIDALEDAIDAQQGDNLGDVAEYQNTIAGLPGDRALTIYISGESVEDAAKAAENNGDVQGFDSDIVKDLGLNGVGMSAMVTAEGIRVDFVGNYESLTEEQKTLMDAQTTKIATADFLPEDTYVYIVGQRLDLIWQNGMDALANSGVSEADVDEAMNLFDDTFGFDPDKDLMPLLDGEYSFALIDSRKGLIADQFNTDLGLVAMMGSSNGEELGGLADDFADGLKDQDLDVNDSSNDDVTVYEIEDTTGERLGAYGVSKDYLIIATDAGNVEDLFTVDGSLADSDKFKSAWDAFPRGTIPVMYMDLTGLFASLEDLDPSVKDAADVNPVYAFAMGTNSNKNTAQTTLIFFIAGE